MSNFELNYMPQNISIRIMFTLKEYIEKMTDYNREVYGETNGDHLTGMVSRMLSTKTDEYIKNYKDDKEKTEKEKIAEYEKNLKETTKNYLIELFKNNDKNLTNFEDENVRFVYDNFKDLEKQVWLLGIIYGMAGYERLDNKFKSHTKRTKEMCEVLKVSKLKFTLATISMSFYLVKVLKNIDKNKENYNFAPELVLKRK